MLFKFSYGANAYTRVPLLECIPRVAQIGYQGIELLADDPHLNPMTISADEIGQIKDACARANLAIVNINANTTACLDKEKRDSNGFWPTLMEPSAEHRRLKLDYIAKTMELAHALGCPGICLSTGPYPKDLARKEADELLLTSMERIVFLAEARETRVGIEYEPGFAIADHRRLIWLFQEFDHPQLGMNLDIGHAQVNGESIGEMIELFAGRIWNIHVEDIKKRVHTHLIPGEGDINFSKMRRALEKTGYERFLSLELYPYKDDPDGAGRKGLDHLRKIFG